MTAIAFKTFSGEIPNLPPHLLPDENAQLAVNCDFAQKDLRPLRQGTLLKTMSNAVKGIYTEDGISFYTWPIETYAYKSPVIDDTNQRVYFNNANGFFVTTTPTSQTGGEPATSWKVGVPPPSVAPVLETVERTTLPDYPTLGFSVAFWYENAGSKYQESEPTVTEVTKFKKYTFTVPARSTTVVNNKETGTPSGSVPNCRFRFISNNADVMAVQLGAGEKPTKSAAFPGGVEVSLSVTGTTATVTIDWGVAETRAYVYTVTNTWSEESAPSEAAVVSVKYLEDVKLTLAQPSFTGYRPFKDFRVYRTVGASANYVRVQTAALTTVSSTVFRDTSHKSTDFGAGLTTLDWLPPPDGLYGLTLMPNGFFAAYKNNTLYFSEAYRPSAWANSMSFRMNIRGVRLGAQALVVTTADGTFLVMGSSPSSMQQMSLQVPQAGISHRSMGNVDGSVVVATNDGMMLVNGNQASMEVSQKYFSREDWRNRYGSVLSTMAFAYHDGFLVATTPSGPGFIIRLDEATGTFSQYNVATDATFYLPVLDTLYYSIGSSVYRFRDASTYYALDWWSKDYVSPEYVCFGAMYLRATGPVTITLYADGEQWYQATLPQTGYYRIPSGKRALRWSLRLQTTAVVTEVALASTMGELRSV